MRSATPGARVFIDEKMVGQAPVVIRNLSAGKHSVRVQRLGYLAAEQEVDVSAGKTAEVQADLLPVAGILKASSNQKGAELFIDNKRIGFLPYEGEISVGKRNLDIRKEGFATYRQTLQVGAGNDYKVVANLQRGDSHDDPPLVAVASLKHKKAAIDDASADNTPALVTPTREKPLGLQPPNQSVETQAQASTPIYAKWWLWTAVGVVAAAAIVTVVVVEAQPSGPPVVGTFRL